MQLIATRNNYHHHKAGSQSPLRLRSQSIRSTVPSARSNGLVLTTPRTALPELGSAFLIIIVRSAFLNQPSLQNTPTDRSSTIGELDDRIPPVHSAPLFQTLCEVSNRSKTTKNDDQRNTIKITKIRPVQLAKITAYFYRELLRTGPGSRELKRRILMILSLRIAVLLFFIGCVAFLSTSDLFPTTLPNKQQNRFSCGDLHSC